MAEEADGIHMGKGDPIYIQALNLLISKGGVALLILAVILFGLWKAIEWMGGHVVMPIVDSHKSFLVEMSNNSTEMQKASEQRDVVLEEIVKSGMQRDVMIKSIAEGQTVISTNQKGMVETQSKTIELISEQSEALKEIAEGVKNLQKAEKAEGGGK